MSFRKNEQKRVFSYICENCDFKSNNKSHYNKHLQTNKHKSYTELQNGYKMDTKTENKTSFSYICEKCDFKSNNKTHYESHLQTKKHKSYVDLQNVQKTEYEKYKCICGNSYKYRQGLYKHKKTCNYQPQPEEHTIIENVQNVDMNMIFDMFCKMISVNQESNALTQQAIQQNGEICKQNGEINKQLISSIAEISKTPSIAGNNNSNNNNNNKTFNLNTFLNVTCKDAENIEDTIKSIEYDISKMVANNITEFIQYICKPITSKPQHLRPIHCTDAKRNSIVVKKENKWEKNADMSPIIHQMREKMFNGISSMNKDWMDNDKLHNKRHTALKFAYGLNDDSAQYDKVTNHICKNTTIDKNNL